jgi:hypothetical protein
MWSRRHEARTQHLAVQHDARTRFVHHDVELGAFVRRKSLVELETTRDLQRSRSRHANRTRRGAIPEALEVNDVVPLSDHERRGAGRRTDSDAVEQHLRRRHVTGGANEPGSGTLFPRETQPDLGALARLDLDPHDGRVIPRAPSYDDVHPRGQSQEPTRISCESQAVDLERGVRRVERDDQLPDPRLVEAK